MVWEDFDINSLAAYLHLTPDQVKKMAERGQVPGRQLGEGWKFSRAEIHHWLEDKIGVLIGEKTVRSSASPRTQPLTS